MGLAANRVVRVVKHEKGHHCRSVSVFFLLPTFLNSMESSYCGQGVEPGNRRKHRRSSSHSFTPPWPRSTRARVSDDKPRAAPARSKPLDFPQYQSQGGLNPVHQDASDFIRLFCELEKRVSPSIIEAFNITLESDVSLHLLIPSDHLPPEEWLQDPSTNPNLSSTDQSPKKLSNGVPAPGHRDFYARAKELFYSMDDISSSISGPPNQNKGGTQPPLRCLHTRKFFQNLLLMAEFWDTSKDRYFTPPTGPSSESAQANSKKDKSKGEIYIGRRQGASHQMPHVFREETIAAFLELAIWPHRCTLQPSGYAITRKLHFQRHRYVPVQHINTAICRTIVNDRQKARRGILEGPLIGVQCRNTTAFRKAGEKPGEGREDMMDFLYEVGAAVLVAQKRAREGTTEELAWKGRFWADGRTRHLGEVGGGKQDQETDDRAKRELFGAEDAMEGVEFSKPRSKEGNEKGSGKDKRQQANARNYLDAKPPESMWEAKMEYRMVGKEVGKGFDTIFIISALNHHISILSVRIHDKWLDFFTNGHHPNPPHHHHHHYHHTSDSHEKANSKGDNNMNVVDSETGNEEEGGEWWKLNVKRSKWYNLFEPGDRVEAFRGVWAAVGWLMREVEST